MFDMKFEREKAFRAYLAREDDLAKSRALREGINKYKAQLYKKVIHLLNQGKTIEQVASLTKCPVTSVRNIQCTMNKG